MADNISLAAASGGSTLATDEIGGLHYQLLKIGYGAMDSWTLVTPASGLPVRPDNAAQWAIAPTRGLLTNRSLGIAAGAVSQQLAPANAGRNYLLIFNPSAETESIFVNFTGPAAADETSIEIPAGGQYLMAAPGFCSTEQVNVLAPTLGHKVGCKEG